MKRRLFAGAVMMICLSLLAYGTLSYFTAQDTAHNVITSGRIEIELQEWADEDKTIPFPQDGMGGAMPGSRITKIAEVKNTGANAAYVRVRVDKELLLAPGSQGEPNPELLAIQFSPQGWLPGEDGYYYYETALEPGAVTPPLFTSILFDPAMDNLYQNCTAGVEVTAYAVQAANNPIPQGGDVTQVSGWPEPAAP